jgi:membrane protease subunit HflC
MNQVNFKKSGSGRISALVASAGILILAIGAFLYMSLYTIKEWEQAVVLQFGDIVGEPVTESGLHFKLPWQQVQRYDKRLLRWDGNQTTAITRDRRTVNIDVTARWRISDARRFREAIGTERNADGRLNGIIESAVRDEIAKFELYEVVRSSNLILDEEAAPASQSTAVNGAVMDPEEMGDLTTLGASVPGLRQAEDGTYLAGRPIVLQGILNDARRRLEQIDLGIELEDVLIKQLGYIREIEANVYAQMNAELQKIAAGFRSSGRERAEERLGEMQRELAIIQSSAVERAQRIRGEAEAEAIRIYADAFNRDPDFFRFMRSLEASERILGANSRVILSTSSPLYQILSALQQTGWDPEGILPVE